MSLDLSGIEAKPRWTAPMLPAAGGEDHLGLASVSSDQILPTLSPTINVLTLHPRYHSFYAFLLDEFWRRDLPRSPRAWTRFFRPRDFAYSVAMHLCDRPEHDIKRGITGSRKTAPLARTLDSFDTQTNYIKESLGGYGLYYRSVLAGLGLLYPGGRRLPYPVDVPTEDGKELAAAFRSAIADTAYYLDYFDQDESSLPRETMLEFARAACLCQLRAGGAPDGEPLRQRFLSEPPEVAGDRRRTFAMMLDLAHQTDGHEIDQDAFRQLVFFGTSTSGATYEPRPALEEMRRKWRFYQAREYYALAITGMWSHLCDWGLHNGGGMRPIELAAVADHVAAACDFDALAAHAGIAAPGIGAESPFADLLEWLVLAAGAEPRTFDLQCGLDSPLSEHRLKHLIYHPGDAVARMAGGIATLGSLFLRFGHSEQRLDAAWTAVSLKGADGRLSVDRFMRSLRTRLAGASPTVGEIARWLVDDYVILQHQLVATGKLPDNTFRFEREGNRLRFHAHNNPVGFSDSRYEALSTTIHELGFCSALTSPDHQLSAAGLHLLEHFDGG